MADIFISYSSEDKSRVQELARALERKGWSVWWDRRIPVWRSYAEVIEEALDAAKAVVVVWTTTSVKSQWVKNEALEGLNRRVLFPVMLEAVKIPLEFRHVHAARLMDWQPEQDHADFEQFIDDLAGAIGAPALQSQAAPASSTKPTSELELEPRQTKVRDAPSGNTNLSALTLSPGILEPPFTASTTDYTVNVGSNVSSVNVSATKADPDAVLSGAMTIGSGTATGQVSISLNAPGAVTPAVLTVTAPNGSSKTYRVIVNRAALVSNNSLSALMISPGSLFPAFNTSTLNYTVDVASTVTSITVTPRLQDTTANMMVHGQATNPGETRTIVLNGPGSSTPLTIVVTAPNGDQKTYTVNVSRAAFSGNNNLQSLTVSPGRLAPSFSASRTEYTVNVGDNVSSITVTPVLQDDNSSVAINGQGTLERQARTIGLNGPGTNTFINLVVTAPNGAYKTYTVEVDRAAEVESEPAQLEPELSAPMADATNSDLPQEPFSSQTATESSRSNQDFGQAGDNRSSESIGTAQSTGSIPYVPIGIGLIAAIGGLVYFLLFSQGSSRQYQSPVQAPSKKTEVVTPTPAPEPTQQVSTTHAQEKPSVKQEAGSTKSITSKKDGASMVLVPGGSFQMGSTRDEVDRAINDCVKELERDQQTCEG